MVPPEITTDTFDQFVDGLFVTGDKPGDARDGLENSLHAAVGCSTEAGEILSSLKAAWIYGRDATLREDILEESGDLLFYVSALLSTFGYSLDDALKANIKKLNKRYPDGFSQKAANERADKQPTTEDCNGK